VPRRSGSDGKLLIGADNRLVLPRRPGTEPAFVPGWWLGLNMMSTLFIRETQPRLPTRLSRRTRNGPTRTLYQRARLSSRGYSEDSHSRVDTGHHRPPDHGDGMSANWWGVAGERIHQIFGRISGSEVLSGIPGSAQEPFRPSRTRSPKNSRSFTGLHPPSSPMTTLSGAPPTIR